MRGARAHELRGQHVILLAQRQELRAHRPRKVGPVEQAEDDRDAEIDDERAPGGGHDRGERHPERDMWQRLDDLDDALRHRIEEAAVVAGEAADDDAEDEADGDAEHADGERDPRPVKDAREDVAAKTVGAEEEERALLGWAEQAARRLEQAPELIRLAPAEETDLLHRLRIDDIVAPERVEVELHGVAIDEGADEAPLVEKVHGLRRSADEIGVAGLAAVGRDRLAEERHEIDEDQEGAGPDGEPVPPELDPHQPPLGGERRLLLLGRHPPDRLRVEGRGRDEMGSGWSAGGKALISSLRLPAARADRAAPARCRRSAPRRR